jgi:hypothetical protein
MIFYHHKGIATRQLASVQENISHRSNMKKWDRQRSDRFRFGGPFVSKHTHQDMTMGLSRRFTSSIC